MADPMRESELLEHIAARSAGLIAGAGWDVLVGPGDDAAVMRSPAGETLLITVDQVVEGRHFEEGIDTDLIARKAVARSVSDIAAMGGRPAWASATAALPAGYAGADELFDRMARWAKRWGCPLVGGDIASHREPDHPLTLTVTVAGGMDADARPVRRAGAHPRDELWVSGAIGGSFASGRHLTFEPRLELGRAAAWKFSGVNAAIDLSDGLGRDAGRLARASMVDAEIHVEQIPLNEPGGDWRAAAGEGEDYELLLAIEPGRGQQLAREFATKGVPLTMIGRTRPPAGPSGGTHGGSPGRVVFVEPDSATVEGAQMGWDH